MKKTKTNPDSCGSIPSMGQEWGTVLSVCRGQSWPHHLLQLHHPQVRHKYKVAGMEHHPCTRLLNSLVNWCTPIPAPSPAPNTSTGLVTGTGFRQGASPNAPSLMPLVNQGTCKCALIPNPITTNGPCADRISYWIRPTFFSLVPPVCHTVTGQQCYISGVTLFDRCHVLFCSIHFSFTQHTAIQILISFFSVM